MLTGMSSRQNDPLALASRRTTNGMGNSTRRVFLKTSSAITAAIALAPAGIFSSQGAELRAADLPKGAAPRPVAFPHFPSRLHAFVWRNWSLVPAARLAAVVGAKPGDILRLGRAMGLDGPPKITRDQQARSYLTVIRRNWHLLPYEQLLALLGWSAEQLAYTLREDDFLYIKLGSLKPQCEPLRYQAAPAGAEGGRDAEIARILQQEFGGRVNRAEDPLFGFVERLSRKPAGAPNRPPSESLRFCYSYFALYGDPLLETGADPYPEGYLAQLAQAGVTGVWLQGVLQKLAPFPWEPARSARYPERLKNLQRLVERARRHGIRVFLYLNEPRALPLRFFQGRPELKGAVEGDHAVLCTSVPEVQAYLTDSIATICRAVPGLGGFFTISASENLSNCWSHGGGAQCPRCGPRQPAAVIAEVNRCFHDGIKKAGTVAQLLAWDWGWDDAWAGDAIRQLPAGVALMSVSEWRLPIERGGVKSEVGEYSISAIGPGPRAKEHWRIARERGLQAIAKVQAGNTWELAAVPYIPAVANVARHAENLRGAEVSGLMLGWTLGGYPSPNLEVVSETLAGRPANEAMQRVAERRFGRALAGPVVKAWRDFSAAFGEYPYHVGVVYSGPQQMGPANLLWAEPTGCHATMVGFPYDDLDAWRSVYPPEVFARQFEKMAAGFARALAELKAAARDSKGATSEQRREFEAECRVAEAAGIHFRSVANQARFVLARRALAAAKGAAETVPHIAALESVLKEEIHLAKRLHQLQGADSRFGFEASNHYFYVPMDLAEKVVNCHYLLTTWLPKLKPA
jgi:hypothetical protein